MESQLNLVRSVSWNYAGYLFEFGSGLLLLAYVVRRVTVHDYGIYLLAQSLAAFLYLLELGMGSVLVPLYVSTYAQKGIAEVGKLASSLAIMLLGLGAAGAFVLSLLALLVPRLLHLPTKQTSLAVHVLITMSVAVSLTLPQMPLEQLCKAFHGFDRVNQVQIAAVVLRVVLTVTVLASGKGIVALAVVQVAVSLLRLAGLWLVTPAAVAGLSLTPRFHRSLLPDVLRMSRWAFGDDISRRIGMNAEQVILGALGSFEQVAIFGVGSRLPAHMYQFAARGLTVLLPTFSQHHADRDTVQLRATFSNALRICATCLLPLSTFAVICARALMSIWAGQAYIKAAPVLSWLLFSALAIILTLPSDIILYSHNRVRQAARFSILETLGKILIALALAARFGAVGVAAGVAIWHWCVNLFFYLPAACRVAEMHPSEIWRNTAIASSRAKSDRTANLVLFIAYVAGIASLAVGMRILPASAVFAAFIFVCLLYAAVWVNFVALPMWRQARIKASAIP
ncbi:MAG TPA: oligosaccharide flippase family protein [Terracidiphilus sp.]